MISHPVSIRDIDSLDEYNQQAKPEDVQWIKDLHGVDPAADPVRFEPLDVFQLTERVDVCVFGCQGSPFSALPPVLICLGPVGVNLTGLSLTTSGELRSAFRIILKDGRIAILVFVSKFWNYRLSLGEELLIQMGAGE